MFCPRCGSPIPAHAGSRCAACSAELTPPDEPTGFGDTTSIVAAPVTEGADVTRFEAADVTRFEAGDVTRVGAGPPARPTVKPRAAYVPAPDDDEPAPPAKPVGPLEIGQSFGPRYHIVRELGVGGMGAVYQAWDEALGISVALKVIRPEATANPQAAQELERRFKQELLLARKVTHKNVVRIHDLGEIDGIKYITMSFVDGVDLSAILRDRGKLDVPTALGIARGIVAGLQAAHDAGIVHRDLKPANVMVEDGQAVIMDFGIARSTTGRGAGAGPSPSSARAAAAAAAGMTTLGTVVGTIEYMAPEQARGEAVDQRADIYALGLIIRDMLLGRLRTTGTTTAIDDLQARLQAAPAPARTVDASIPEPLDHIITKCLQPDAAARFQTTIELGEALAKLDDRGELIPQPPRYSKKAVAAAVAAVALAAAGTWYVVRPKPIPKPHDPVSVLIADIQNRTGDAAFDRTLEPVLKMSLESAGFISAYDRAGIRTLGVRAPAKLDEVAAQQIAVKQAVGVVLTASLSHSDNGYELSVKAAQAVTGNVIAATMQKTRDKSRVLSLATNLAATVRKALGDNTSDAAHRFAMDTLSAANLDAVHEYANGQVALSNNNSEEAIQSYKRAIAHDPNFGAAYIALALASGNVGRQQDAETYAKEALRHLDSMTERERYRARGSYYRVTGDYQHCVNEYGFLVARYAADAAARNQLALCMSNLRQFANARNELKRAVEILPKRALYRINEALYASYGSDFQAGETDAQAAQELSPSAEYGFVALAFAQLGQGRVQDAIGTYQKLAASGSPLGASLSISGLGDVAAYDGRFAEAASLFQKGAAADIAAGNNDRAAAKFTALAYTRLQQRQRAPAIAAAENALKNSQIAKIRFLAGRVLGEAGEIAKAKTLAEGLAAELQAEPQALGKILEGDLALGRKDPREAVKRFTEANALLDTWIGHFDLGRANFDAGAFTQADTEFDQCLKRRGEVLALLLDEEPTYRYLPAAFYFQGRVREALKTEKFADSYRTYLDLRGKAGEDPLLPEIRRRAGM